MRIAPTDIQIIGNEFAIRWNDGAESYLPLEDLRKACPCATCGGEPDVMGHVVRPQVTHTPSSFRLKGWNLVGSYAVQLSWEDGHNTGLYSFPYLQNLAKEVGSGMN